MHVRLLLLGFVLFTLVGCPGRRPPEEKPERLIATPTFSGDSAYQFTADQVAFGPRVPNTPAHRSAGDYMINKLKQYGATVVTQEFDATTFDGKKVFLRNIIASFQPAVQKRILLACHWDTRPFADRDKGHPNAPMDGANDGASGVGVMLEIARLIAKGPAPSAGVDLIFFDGEDWGEREGHSNQVPLPEGLDAWWCLGSQYWATHKHKPNYSAYYGILLDMVGGKNARFFKEGYSREYAPRILDKVWNAASRLGHSQYFVTGSQGGVMDDHYYVNVTAKIPMIDIIPYDPSVESFGAFHHTTGDNLDIISRETLHVVGEVIVYVVYQEE